MDPVWRRYYTSTTRMIWRGFFVSADTMGTQAIKTCFGDHASQVMISSTKSIFGHTFGAAGAIEAAISILSVLHGVMPPTINLQYPDPECDLNYIPNQARRADVCVALSNSMDFGGHNSPCLLQSYT